MDRMQKISVLAVCVFFTQLLSAAHQEMYDPIATAQLQELLNGPAVYSSEAFEEVGSEVEELVGCRNADPALLTPYGLPVISLAAAEGKRNIVEVLLQSKADPNQLSRREQTPLHFARDHKVAELLLKAKADINDQNREGQTPLDKAIEERKSRELIDFLCAHGAQKGDVNKRVFWNCSKEQALKFEPAG